MTLDTAQRAFLEATVKQAADHHLTPAQVIGWLMASSEVEEYLDYVRDHTGEPMAFPLWYTHRCVEEFAESFALVAAQQNMCDDALLAMGQLKAGDLPP